MNRSSWSFVLLAVLSSSAVAADPEMTRLAQQRRDAARRTYEKTWANYRDGRAPADLLYRWSKRWLAAEKDLSDRPADRLAAFKAHWERMTELDRLVRTLHEIKQATIDEVTGAEFYRVEAELWMLQAQKDAKER